MLMQGKMTLNDRQKDVRKRPLRWFASSLQEILYMLQSLVSAPPSTRSRSSSEDEPSLQSPRRSSRHAAAGEKRRRASSLKPTLKSWTELSLSCAGAFPFCASDHMLCFDLQPNIGICQMREEDQAEIRQSVCFRKGHWRQLRQEEKRLTAGI